jgi:hypothetical protein
MFITLVGGLGSIILGAVILGTVLAPPVLVGDRPGRRAAGWLPLIKHTVNPIEPWLAGESWLHSIREDPAVLAVMEVPEDAHASARTHLCP